MNARNARKARWLCKGDCIVNLDNVNAFFAKGGDVAVAFANGGAALMENTSIAEVRDHLKYGKPRRRKAAVNHARRGECL